LLLLAPAGIVMLLVVGYPLGRLVVNSFQDYGLRALFSGQTSFIGFQNYAATIADPQFWPVMVRTFVFTAILVVVTLVIGMSFSLLMIRMHAAIRTAFSLILVAAWAVPTVASTLVWQWLFQPLYGIVNWMLTRLVVFGDLSAHSWITDSMQGFTIVGLLIVWQAVPFVALTLYAGQTQIPAEYYEAAMLDGASGWQIYRIITMQFLRPIITLVAILSIIWDFNVFNQIQILTQGGPDEGTTTIGIWTYQVAFNSNAFGQASAIAVITVLVLVVLTGFYVRRLVRQGEEL
jgi:N,N'-diacetylchitobiose transport system permease protein